MGAVTGIGQYASRAKRHEEFGEIIAFYRDDLDLEELLLNYVRCFESFGYRRFEEDLAALEKLFSETSLAREAVVRLMVQFLGFTRAGYFDSANRWILENVPMELQRGRLGQLFTEWSRKDPEKLRDWILELNSPLHELAAFDALASILDLEGRSALMRADTLLNAITDDELRARGQKVLEQKQKLAEE